MTIEFDSYGDRHEFEPIGGASVAKIELQTWQDAFNERHEFDLGVYPDHFMSGLRNEFCAGWHAALKAKEPQ